jgi:hypothetical protein
VIVEVEEEAIDEEEHFRKRLDICGKTGEIFLKIVSLIRLRPSRRKN